MFCDLLLTMQRQKEEGWKKWRRCLQNHIFFDGVPGTDLVV